jgi:hypothetical protein
MLREFGENGLYGTGIAMTNLEWAAFSLPVDPPPARPYPTSPLHPAGGAGAGTVAIYNQEKNLYINFQNNVGILKSKIISAIGPSISGHLEHPTTGFRNISIIDILDHLHLYYGKLTPQVFGKLMEAVDAPFTDHSLEGYQASTNELRKKFEILASNGQPFSEMQKMKKLIDNTREFMGMNECVRQFYIDEKVAINQNFQNLSVFVSTHYSNFIEIETMNNFSGKSFAITQRISTEKLRTGSPGKHRASTPPSKKYYCYVHNWNATHNGCDCFVMKKQGSINKKTGKPFTKLEIESRGKH